MTDYDFAFSPDPVNEDPFAEAQPVQDAGDAELLAAASPEPSQQLEVTAPSPRGSPQASPRGSVNPSPQASPRLQASPQASPRMASPLASPRPQASPRSQTGAVTTPRAGDDEDVFGLDAPARGSVSGQEDLKFEGKESLSALPSNDALTLWQTKRAEELRKRRDAAREKKEQQKETGKEEAAKFLADREAKIQKTKALNAEEEKNHVTDMATLMEHGSLWEKVHKLVNLQPKPNEKPGSSRKERMRGLLIQLKHEKK